jgi:hypothetical protein
VSVVVTPTDEACIGGIDVMVREGGVKEIKGIGAFCGLCCWCISSYRVRRKLDNNDRPGGKA